MKKRRVVEQMKVKRYTIVEPEDTKGFVVVRHHIRIVAVRCTRRHVGERDQEAADTIVRPRPNYVLRNAPIEIDRCRAKCEAIDPF